MPIEFEVDAEGIATVTINRPERLNALDDAHYGELSVAWTRVRDEPRVRCAIVTGAGEKSFCAGADIKEVVGKRTELQNLWLTQWEMLLNRGLEIWKPVIAAVNGYCLGGGMTLLLATDLRIAVPSAQFGLAEVKRGVIAGNGGTQRLLRQVPHAIAMELILLGETIDATRAAHCGLINRIVEPAALLTTAKEFARKIARNAPLAVQASKELALRSRDMSLGDGMRLENMVSTILQSLSQDVGEGRAAFLEKRAANFQGR
ncbi:MAG: enoyl-CoA hydratase/isomerase family protein [Alphaproteobacteria bacterium]|nr:enoyl-CoA hydratase/isomerase family protein [Alphaproteobacteria bacterium]